MNNPIRPVPRGLRSRSELERLAEYVAVTVRRACITTINVRHRPVCFAAARRSRAPPVFQKFSQDRETTRGQPGPTDRYEPHQIDSPDSL